MIDWKHPDKARPGADPRPWTIELASVVAALGTTLLIMGPGAGLGALPHGLEVEAILGGTGGVDSTLAYLLRAIALTLALLLVTHVLIRHGLVVAFAGGREQGRRAERARGGPLLAAADVWLPVVDQGEKPRAGVLVDTPDTRRPTVLLALSLQMVTLASLGILASITAVQSMGSVWLEDLLAMQYGLVPLAWLAVASLCPGDRFLFLFGCAGALGIPMLTSSVSGISPWLFTGHPAVLGGWVLAILLAVWLCRCWWNEPDRVLLLTSSGLRLAEATSRGVRCRRGPCRPATLTLAPGMYQRRWCFSGGEGEAFEVRPLADHPESFVEAAAEEGLALEVERRGAVPPLGVELRDVGARVLLIPALILLAHRAVVPILGLGLHLGLDVIPHIGPAMESRAGGEAMKAGARKTLAAFPECHAARVFLALMQYTDGDLTAAAESLAVMDRQVAALRLPELLEPGQSKRLRKNLREEIEAYRERERPVPPEAWVPTGADGERFQVLLDGAGGVKASLWVEYWPEHVGEMLTIAGRHPEAAGPAWTGALLAYAEDDSEKLRAMLLAAGVDPASLPPPAPPKPPAPAPRTTAERLDQVSRMLDAPPPAFDLGRFHQELRLALARRDLVQARLEALEDLPAWRGSAARLAGRLPAEIASEFSAALRQVMEDQGHLDHPVIREALPALADAHYVEAPKLAFADPSPLAVLATEPPASLDELVSFWPQLDFDEHQADRDLRELIQALGQADLEDPLASPRVKELWEARDAK